MSSVTRSYANTTTGTFRDFQISYRTERTHDPVIAYNTEYVGFFNGFQGAYAGGKEAPLAWMGTFVSTYDAFTLYNKAWASETSVYSGTFVGERQFTNSQTGYKKEYAHEHEYVKVWSKTWEKDYNRNYSKEWVKDWSKDWAKTWDSSAATYTAVYEGVYVAEYVKTYTKSYDADYSATYVGKAAMWSGIWAAANIFKDYTGVYSASTAYTSVVTFAADITYEGPTYSKSYVGATPVGYSPNFNGFVPFVSYSKTYTSLVNFNKLYLKTYLGARAYGSDVIDQGSFEGATFTKFFRGDSPGIIYTKEYTGTAQIYTGQTLGKFTKEWAGVAEYVKAYTKTFEGVAAFTPEFIGTRAYSKAYSGMKSYQGVGELYYTGAASFDKTYSGFTSYTGTANFEADFLKEYTGARNWDKVYIGPIGYVAEVAYEKHYEKSWEGPKDFNATFDAVLYYKPATQSFVKDYVAHYTGTRNYTSFQSFEGSEALYTGVYRGIAENSFRMSAYVDGSGNIFVTFDKYYVGEGPAYSGARVWNKTYTAAYVGTGPTGPGTFTKDWNKAYQPTEVFTKTWLQDFSTDYTKVWEKSWIKDYEKTYSAAYTKVWSKAYEKTYVGSWTAVYAKIYTSAVNWGSYQQGGAGVFYAGPNGARNVDFTKVWEKTWSADYVKSWSIDYTAVYNKDWVKSYQKNYDKSYDAVYTKVWQKDWNKDYEGLGVGFSSFLGGWTGAHTSVGYFEGVNYFAKDYEKNYVKSYDKNWVKTYTKNYDKDYVAAYDKDYVATYDKNWVKAYEASYEKNWVKTYTTDYEKNYEAAYLKIWNKVYTAGLWNKDYTKVWSKIWTKTYEKNWVKDYDKTYDAVYTKTYDAVYATDYNKDYGADYTKIWAKSWLKDYVKTYTTTYLGPVFYGSYTPRGTDWNTHYVKTYVGTLFFGGFALHTSYNKDYTKTWLLAIEYTKDWEKTYTKNYDKDYDAVYAKVWTKTYAKDWTKVWNKDYTKIWTKVWQKDYVAAYDKDYATDYDAVYVKTWQEGVDYTKDYEAAYNKDWVKAYTKDWNKDYVAAYAKDWNKDYVGSYDKNWVKTYEKNWIKTYEKNYEKDYVATYDKDWVKAYQKDYAGPVNWTAAYSGTSSYEVTRQKPFTPSYTGDQDFAQGYKGTLDTHTPFSGTTSFVGPTTGELSESAPRVQIKYDDNWETIQKLHVMQDNAFKEVKVGYVKTAGVWKAFHIGYKHVDIQLNSDPNGIIGQSAAGLGRGSTTQEGKITYFVNNFNLRDYLVNRGDDPDNVPHLVTITVGEEDVTAKNFIFGSQDLNEASLDLSTMVKPTVNVDGSVQTEISHLVKVVVQPSGYVVGKGGTGGHAYTAARGVGLSGGNGGDAIKTANTVELFIENYGIIGGGGGGGGAGGITDPYSNPTGTYVKTYTGQSYQGSAGAVNFERNYAIDYASTFEGQRAFRTTAFERTAGFEKAFVSDFNKAFAIDFSKAYTGTTFVGSTGTTYQGGNAPIYYGGDSNTPGAWSPVGTAFNKLLFFGGFSGLEPYVGSFVGATYTGASQTYIRNWQKDFNQSFERSAGFTGAFAGTFTGAEVQYTGAFLNYVGNYQKDYVKAFEGPATFVRSIEGEAYVGFAGADTNFVKHFVGTGTGDAFTRTYAASFVDGYTRSFEGTTFTRVTAINFTGEYSQIYTGTFEGNYSKDYAPTYTKSWGVNYTKSFASPAVTSFVGTTGSFTTVADVNFDTNYTVEYARDYTPTDVTSFTNQYASSFARTAGFEGNFRDEYAGVYQKTFSSTFEGTADSGFISYTGASGSFSGTAGFQGELDYAKAWAPTFVEAYSRQAFAGSFSNIFTTLTFDGLSYVHRYVDAASTANYVGNFSASYQKSYEKVWSTNYDGSFTNDLTGAVRGYTISGFSGPYTKVFFTLGTRSVNYLRHQVFNEVDGFVVGSTANFTGGRTQTLSYHGAPYQDMYTGTYTKNWVGLGNVATDFSKTYHGRVPVFYSATYVFEDESTQDFRSFTKSWQHTSARAFNKEYTGNVVTEVNYEAEYNKSWHGVGTRYTGTTNFSKDWTAVYLKNYVKSWEGAAYDKDWNVYGVFAKDWTGSYSSVREYVVYTRAEYTGTAFGASYQSFQTYRTQDTQFAGEWSKQWSKAYASNFGTSVANFGTGAATDYSATYSSNYGKTFVGSFGEDYNKTFSGLYIKDYGLAFVGSTFEGSFTKGWNQTFDILYTKTYSDTFDKTFTLDTFTGTYQTSFKPEPFAKDYVGSWQGTYEKDYGLFTKLYANQNWDRVYAKNYIGAFVNTGFEGLPTFTAAYTGSGGTFLKDWVAASGFQSYGAIQTTYEGNVATTYTGGAGNFAGRNYVSVAYQQGRFQAGFGDSYTSTFGQTFETTYTTNYDNQQFSGFTDWTKTYVKNYDSTWTGVFERAWGATYTKDWGASYTKDWAKNWVKTYQVDVNYNDELFYGAYARNWLGAYRGTWDSAYEGALFIGNYVEVFYGGFSRLYASYTGTIDYNKDYAVNYTGAYAKVWAREYADASSYLNTYDKTFTGRYEKDYNSTAYQGDITVSYVGVAETSGTAGSGGAGWEIGRAGTTGAPDEHLHVAPGDSTLLNGGVMGKPMIEFGHTKINGGIGGNLGNIGSGGGEHFQRKTRYAQSGDGGLPGAAIKGYNANYVTFIHTGNVLGDPQFKYVT